QFSNEEDCEAVLEALIAAKANDENVIVNESRSRCLPTAKEQQVFASVDEANRQLADAEDWGILPAGEEREQEPAHQSSNGTQAAYQSRLESLPECDAGDRVTPCKVGQIIVESDTAEDVQVWKKDEEEE
ncbi:MAG: hypothetical protein ACREQ8_15235, partial [Woeseiaceae bacterium]